ncbi:MAG TPA: TetR family transcriptional regulator [Rhizomicrobium sp.]|jgi:TPR repeat protein
MAQEARNTQDSAWQHAQTREAILEAARGLLAHGEPGTLSLDAVGDATGFAHATIYAYFASRQDLLTSLFCDDFCAFARGLAESFPFSEPEPEPETAVLPFVAPQPEPEPEPEAVQPDVTEVPEPEPVAIEEPQPEAEEAPQPVGEEPAQPEAVQAEAPSGDEIADMRAAIARLEARKVDAWLERRLRVFEKTLTDLEARVTGAEGTTTRSAALVAEGVKSVGERAEALDKHNREASDGIAERLEAADRKARSAAAELRAALNDVYGRLETLEIAKGTAVTPTPPLDAAWEAGEATIAPATETKTDKPFTEAAETYLSAARRAARTAAELAEIERGNNFVASARSWTRTKLIVAACVALVAVMIVAGLVLRQAMPAHNHIVRPIVALAPVTPVAARPVAIAPKPAVATSAPAVPAHHDMATYRLSALASTGNADAELLLGLRTLDGDGVAKDDGKAAQLLQQSAAQGNATAQYWLGTLYERGRGVTQDPAAAWHWYQSAAKKGNVKAMYNLGEAYAHGKGTKVNLAQAAHWFWVSAMQGYVDAQYNLAVLYERGQGVPQSLINAYKWYAIAAAAGDKDSSASIDALKTQLKSADLSAGEHAATAYKPASMDHAANDLPGK